MNRVKNAYRSRFISNSLDSCLPTEVPVMSGLVFVQAVMHLQWEILRAVELL